MKRRQSQQTKGADSFFNQRFSRTRLIIAIHLRKLTESCFYLQEVNGYWTTRLMGRSPTVCETRCFFSLLYALVYDIIWRQHLKDCVVYTRGTSAILNTRICSLLSSFFNCLSTLLTFTGALRLLEVGQSNWTKSVTVRKLHVGPCYIRNRILHWTGHEKATSTVPEGPLKLRTLNYVTRCTVLRSSEQRC